MSVLDSQVFGQASMEGYCQEAHSDNTLIGEILAEGLGQYGDRPPRIRPSTQIELT